MYQKTKCVNVKFESLRRPNAKKWNQSGSDSVVVCVCVCMSVHECVCSKRRKKEERKKEVRCAPEGKLDAVWLISQFLSLYLKFRGMWPYWRCGCICFSLCDGALMVYRK